MSHPAKFATDSMANRAVEMSTNGEEGFAGDWDSMAENGFLPSEMPCEAGAIYDASGYLRMAKSADGLNAQYFHVEGDDSSGYWWPTAEYPAQDNTGNDIQVNEGTIMTQFIGRQINYFFLNGERFTLSKNREEDLAPGACDPCTATAPGNRGALVFVNANGVAIFVYSGSKPVRTEERMGKSAAGAALTVEPISGGALLGKLSPFFPSSDNVFNYL